MSNQQMSNQQMPSEQIPNKYDIKDNKDNIILRLQQIISELENENKELCKKLGLIYRPRIQFGGKNDPNDGDGEDNGDD